MLYNDFKNFKAALPETGKIMGIDWGEKRMGFAVSSPDRNFVFTRPQNSDPLQIVEEENIVGIVLGLPLRLDGSESETTEKVMGFARILYEKTELPIILFDESLTSYAAEEHTKEKKAIDSVAAQILLENAIEMMKRSN